jgi:formate C-acetyltransferase/benzylsuccinate synthase
MRSWHALNIDHVQFNMVDSATLKAAQKEPDKYRDVMVRVAGYSAYFIELDKGCQDSIIARTAQEM